MKVWEAEDGNYTYRITEEREAKFNITIDFLGKIESLWFESYSGARTFLKREYYFTGRMKRIS
ncbi:hypothetical protein P5750_22365 [Bacillus cereus]|uniref:hypothetical protein n=1 Tax=Bacillus cereus TaxID=1396 RepID=UPI0024074B23|nr:hypothetical protein [Bacillus cereus]MDF9538113.1 hypothetical protein [Bacillus cereus]MDF9586195.1 hypothetical protein [Bacillus cereus]MDG1591620.1 hypothetical protein [Bacillus cereus]